MYGSLPVCCAPWWNTSRICSGLTYIFSTFWFLLTTTFDAYPLATIVLKLVYVAFLAMLLFSGPPLEKYSSPRARMAIMYIQFMLNLGMFIFGPLLF